MKSESGPPEVHAPYHPAGRTTVPLQLPGLTTIVVAALAIGLLLMGIQLWLLTVALDLLLAGKGGELWRIALVSAAIFGGGLVMLWVLRRRPRARQPQLPADSVSSTDGSGSAGRR